MRIYVFFLCSFFFRDVVRTYIFFSFLLLEIHYSYIVIANLVLIDVIYIYDEVVITFFHLSLHVLFLFSLYAHVFYILYAIYYFCFTLRCRDEFCLKCFKNTGCQSLRVMNSLLAKFFKSLC